LAYESATVLIVSEKHKDCEMFWFYMKK